MTNYTQLFLEFLTCYERDNILYYNEQLKAIHAQNKRELYVNLSHVYDYSPDLAKYIIDEPDEALEFCNDIFKSKLPLTNSDEKYYVRFYSDNNINLKGIRQLRKNDIDRLVYVAAVVVKASPVRSIITSASFECRECGNIMLIIQDTENLTYPNKCSNPNCNVTKKERFKYRSRESEKLDIQILKVQEPHSELERPGDIPYMMTVYLYDNIVDYSRTGQHVKIMGIYRNQPTRDMKGGQKTICEPYITANNIEAEDIEQADDISDDDVHKIKKLAEEIDIRTKIVNSVAPHIYGSEHLKMAAALSLFGGVEKEKIRGLIHVLFMGDPSTGKSQIIKCACELSPRHIYTSGQGSSAAGLTAAVLNDASMGGWTLEAGALPRASGGVCAIDEFDKMSEQDRKAIHEVMEQQTASISKAGIVATLPSKTTIIAAANPRSGHYDEYKTATENINLTPAIISRFDLIFIVRDRANEKSDAEIADQILNNHLGLKKENSPSIIEKDLLRKYIIHAKRECSPKLNENLKKKIKDFYVEIRKKEGGFMVARNLDGIVRLCEAHAKMALQTEVTDEDVDTIIDLMTSSLKQLGYDPETGMIDMDRVLTGVNKKERENHDSIYENIRNLLIEKYQQTKETPYLSFDEIFKKCSQITSKEQLKALLRNMHKQHQIKIESNNRISTEEKIWLFKPVVIG